MYRATILIYQTTDHCKFAAVPGIIIWIGAVKNGTGGFEWCGIFTLVSMS
jgi:hypothetical protein